MVQKTVLFPLHIKLSIKLNLVGKIYTDCSIVRLAPILVSRCPISGQAATECAPVPDLLLLEDRHSLILW